MRIIIFGDSITQGFFDEEQGGWANRLHIHTVKEAVRTDHEYDVDVFVQGISGDCTNRLLKRFDIEFTARARNNADIVILPLA